MNASIDALHSGECLRAIVNIGESDIVQVRNSQLISSAGNFIFNPADQAAEAEEQREDGGGLHEAAVALERGKPVRDDLLCLPPHPCFQDSPSSTCECL